MRTSSRCGRCVIAALAGNFRRKFFAAKPCPPYHLAPTKVGWGRFYKRDASDKNPSRPSPNSGREKDAMIWPIYLSVAIQGVLTGLVYGLMALGLSVIFGVVRVVNFAHGEFAVVAMYAAFLLFTLAGIDPLLAMVPIAIAFFGIGYALQLALVHRFVGRAE